MVRGLNKNLFTRAQGFRDRVLLRTDPAAIREIRSESAAATWTLAQGDSGWVVVADGDTSAARTQNAEQISRSLAAFNADGFADDIPDSVDTGLGEAHATLTVIGVDGEETVLTVGEMNSASQRYLTSSRREGTVYLIGDWRITNLLKPVADLLPEEPDPGSP